MIYTFVQSFGIDEEMASFWIATFLEYTDFSRGAAKELFARVRKDGKWYIGPKTQNKKRIQKGDKVIFYQAGKSGRRFVGDGTLSTSLQPASENDFFDFVIISGVRLWSKPLSIYEIGKELSFVKTKNPAQYYFQMGIRRIAEKDYLTILQHRKSSTEHANSRQRD